MKTQRQIALEVHGIGLPTHEWVLVYADTDGQLASVSPMAPERQGRMLGLVARSFAEGLATLSLETTPEDASR